MKVLIVESEKVPRVADIKDDLKEMQKLVGGTIQVIYPFSEEVALVCNDEGKLLGMPLNRGLRDEEGNLYDIISGTFFLCDARSGEDTFSSLTDEELDRFQRLFHTPEMFVNLNGRIITIANEDVSH